MSGLRIEIKNKKIKVFKQNKDLLFKSLRGLSVSPSSLDSLAKCGGFLSNGRARSSEAADEGNRQHEKMFREICKAIIKKEKPKSKYPLYVLKQARKIKRGKIFLEWGRKFNWKADVYTLGFLDCMLVNEEKKTAEVIDYKSGYFKIHPKDNLQTVSYTHLRAPRDS